MSKIRPYEPDPELFQFKCPGCKEDHIFSPRAHSFNGDMDNPTIHPSILVRGNNIHCHSYIENGMILFQGDCNHELKNQTVELPDYAND